MAFKDLFVEYKLKVVKILKRQVRTEYVNFLNMFLEFYYKESPKPKDSPYSYGYFIRNLRISVAGKTRSKPPNRPVNPRNHLQTNIDLIRTLSGFASAVSLLSTNRDARGRFIKLDIPTITISNTATTVSGDDYYINVEERGWRNKPAYAPMIKALNKSIAVLNTSSLIKGSIVFNNSTLSLKIDLKRG